MKPHVKSIKGARIYVGLSGGVDSAVTAALLKEAGAHVTGVFIKGWYPEGMHCTWASERRDAMRVAARLSIPFRTLDASQEYKQGVIDYLLQEYKAGRTPNPDIMCNREVKFGAFMRYAKDSGADFVATGHYAQTKEGMLMRGVDAAKDQSYFLWAVPKEALVSTLFPLGGLRKEEVRTLAKRYNLPVADKKDSQGICFLGSVSVEEYLRQEFGETPGIATDTNGTEVGTHNGVLLHTIGERIALKDAAPGPWYVLKKDIAGNQLVVGKEVPGTGSKNAIALEQVNLLEEATGALHAQYRYHGPLVPGTFSTNVFTPTESLSEPIASGQSLVLYHGDTCIGGGIIR